jgi:hypothetical protein
MSSKSHPPVPKLLWQLATVAKFHNANPVLAFAKKKNSNPNLSSFSMLSFHLSSYIYTLPISIASFGQVTTHSPQPLQRLASTETFFASFKNLIALGSGQAKIHNLHPVHLSTSIFAAEYTFYPPLCYPKLLARFTRLLNYLHILFDKLANFIVLTL